MTIEQAFKYNPSATYSTGGIFSKKINKPHKSLLLLMEKALLQIFQIYLKTISYHTYHKKQL